MAIGVERRASKPVSRPDHALLLQPLASNAMSYTPLAHTSGVGLPVTDSIPNHSSHGPVDFDPPVPTHTAGPSPPQQGNNKKRRHSKSKVATDTRRSSSTPYMRSLPLQNSGELSPTADKRRNKLGYHRTSVACGHCRRRKIRCLVAADDPQGRCANCIRLKKECNFYPVDQAADNQRSQSSMSKDANPTAPASSATSSPRHPASASDGKVEEFRPPFSGPGVNALPSRYGMHEADVDPNQMPHSGGMPHPAYGYPASIETQWSTPGFLPSSSIAESSPSSGGYWRQSPSTANSTYGSDSNMSGGQTPATMSTASNVSYGSHHEGHSWAQPNMQPPTRSMSYGNIEGIPHQYSNPGLGIQPHNYPRRTSPYPYPTTLDTNPSTVHSTSLGSNSSAPLSAPILPNQQFGYPHAWNPFGGIPSSAHEVPIQGRSMSAQWYSEPGQLDQVQEEGSPPVAYGHHGLPPFYPGPQ